MLKTIFLNYFLRLTKNTNIKKQTNINKNSAFRLASTAKDNDYLVQVRHWDNVKTSSSIV